MKTLIYFGNKLEERYGIETVMESLIKGFKDFVHVESASIKSTQLGKLFDFTALFFKKRNADLVIIDVFSTRAFWFAVYLSLLCVIYNKKYILVLHGGGLPNRFANNPTIFGWILKKAHKVTAPSKYLMTFFEAKGFNIQFIPNPIRVSDYNKGKAYHQSQTIKLLYLRGFGSVYRPNIIVEVGKLLKDQSISFELHMFGRDFDGEMMQIADLVKNHQLQSHIIIHGPTPKSVWLKTAQECTINLSVPVVDNTPVSILECMALGIPTISTDVGGVPFIITHLYNGILVDDEPARIVEAILMLSNDSKLYNAISHHAREYVAQYDYPNVISMWQKIIDSC